MLRAGPQYNNFDINDFDIKVAHLSSLASTNAATDVPYRVVYITLLDTVS